MLRQERVEDSEETMRTMLDGFKAQLWTALPGEVESFDAAKQTAVVQPTLKGVWRAKDGSISTHTLPLCLDVSVFKLRGGGFSATVPIIKGTEGLLIFASRCIDSWWQSGGVQEQNELRAFDLSDGLFFPGINSQAQNLDAYATDGIQLRNDAGDTTLTLKDGEVDIVAITTKVQGDLNITGKLNVSGLTVIGDPGTAKFVKLADGTNSTLLKA